MPLLLYSVNTAVAYSIAQVYYGEVHYVWCSPCFDSRQLPSHDPRNPPTSNPCEVLQNLAEEVLRGDRHSTRIEQNKVGIRRGAGHQLKERLINRAERKEIDYIIQSAEIAEFRPLLYVMPFANVAGIAARVSVGRRAHPLSSEYIISALPRNMFDVVDFYRR